MRTYCRHAYCIAHAVQELTFIAMALPHRRIADKIKAMRSLEVRCRRVPRQGAVRAPFPGEQE